jgi:uncharacterized protein YndB with AHSA1/START domain
MTNQMVSTVEDKVLILEREFNAPRELVFQAFTQAEHLKHCGVQEVGHFQYVMLISASVGWHYCMKCETRIKAITMVWNHGQGSLQRDRCTGENCVCRLFL